MSKMTQKLKDGEHPADIELLDYIIQLQLSKIEKYNDSTLKSSSKINDSTEYAMSNLITLLEIRHEIYSESDVSNFEVID